MRLEQWQLTFRAFGQHLVLSGLVYENPKFPEGSHIHTSKVIAIDFFSNQAFTSSGSCYQLGEPYRISCEDLHGQRLCEEGIYDYHK